MRDEGDEEAVCLTVQEKPGSVEDGGSGWEYWEENDMVFNLGLKMAFYVDDGERGGLFKGPIDPHFTIRPST